jgi:predicted nucleic acid-binding protein
MVLAQRKNTGVFCDRHYWAQARKVSLKSSQQCPTRAETVTSNGYKILRLTMFLIDTNVVSEARKKRKANAGVQSFFRRIETQAIPVFLSVISIGELRRGVDLIHDRGDGKQALLLERWLNTVIHEFDDKILDFTTAEAQVWGHLRVPHYQNAIDKQIAATALTHDLTLATRNLDDFIGTGVKLVNPFT